MRVRIFLLCLLILGCGPAADLPSEPAPEGKGELPPDLRTRKTGSDWPSFLGPLGTSVSTEKGILTSWPKEGPRLVWSKEIGIGYAMPTISRGRLFHFDRHGNQARLSAFESETGKFLWKFEYLTSYDDFYGYNNGPRCCPVVDDDRVYLHGVEGMLHCVRAVDGKLLWKLDTVKEFHVIQNFFGVGSTPVIEGDLLLVHIGGSTKESGEEINLDMKGNGTALVAFDKYTGKVRWKTSDELASYASPVLATIDQRRWCFMFARGGLVGLDPTTGKVDFHYPWRARIFESVNASNPVVVGDQVLVTECYGVGASLLKVKPGGYDVVWKDNPRAIRKNLECHWNTPVYDNGYVYGSSGRHSQNAELSCVEFATGKVKWSEPGLDRTSLLKIDGHFVCLGEYGRLQLLKINPNKYEVVAEVPEESKISDLLQYPCWAAPIVSHGLLYVRGKDHLLCLELIPEK